MKSNKQSTLQITFPIGKTFLLAALILMFIAGASEAALRLWPGLRAKLPPPSIGLTDWMFELKLPRLEESVAARDGVDVIFVGSSMTNKGINAELFENEYTSLTGKTVRVFNMGLNGLRLQDKNVVSRYLEQEFSPCLIVYGTTVWDYDVRTESTRYSDNLWMRVQFGDFSAEGWLGDKLISYQYLLLFRNWMKDTYVDRFQMRQKSEETLTPLGFSPTDKIDPTVNTPPSTENELDRIHAERQADYVFDPQRLEILGQMLALQETGVRVLLLELPTHPTYVSFYPREWDDHAQFIDEMSQFTSDRGVDFWPTLGYVTFSDQFWFNRNHLNTLGAEIFTRWVAEEMAASSLLEGLGDPGGCAAANNPGSPANETWSLPPLEKKASAFSLDINKNRAYFAGFVLLVLAVYYLLPRRPQNYWLLLVSYLFYLTWAWEFGAALLALTLVNYALGRRLQAAGRWQRSWLWAGIGFNLLALAFFKYNDFFVPKILSLLGRLDLQIEAGGLNILMPIGLSFLALQAISYLIDVARGRLEASTDPVDFALYLAYFPKLLSGPIERARTFLPVLAQERVVDNAALARSLGLILVGLARKMVIADSLARMIPSQVFEPPIHTGAPALTYWLLAYAFYIYNDFAGYTSIMRGVSGLFGIQLSPNFRQPYFARSFTEFWNRWHISFSHWLRDYIYFPLSRALRRKFPKPEHPLNVILPPVVTMLASGLWHGAAWPMLVWGGLHGVYQVVERLPLLWGAALRPPQERPRWRQGLGMLVVFGLAALAWVPFRLDLPLAVDYWRGMLNWSVLQPPDGRLVVVVVLALGLDWMQSRREDGLVFLGWPRPVRAALLAAALLAIFFVAQADVGAPFVYQGF